MPGSEHKLNRANFEASQPKTIAPEIRMMMAMTVLNMFKDSTSGTRVTRPDRYCFVAETVTRLREMEPRGLSPDDPFVFPSCFAGSISEEMEPRGFEPLTSSMPLRRSTN